MTYRIPFAFAMCLVSLVFPVSAAEELPSVPIDTHADTWFAADDLGRVLPGADEVGQPREGKYVGIFYFGWLGQHGTDGPYDITRILRAHPGIMSEPKNSAWGPQTHYHHWGEPLFGYYLSDDTWVIRKHAQMLADAGVDVIILDVTNEFTYPKVCTRLGEVFTQVRRDGGRTPQIAFLCPFWNPTKTAVRLYEDLYRPGRFSELWFRWKSKPLLLADPAKVDEPIKDFFTFRKPQPDYFQGPTGPDQWGWLEKYPQHVFRNSAGEPEQMTVGIGQNTQGTRCCAFSEKGTYGRSWHNGAKDTRPGSVNLGLNFAEQWERALKEDPQFIFITGWNEWIAMRLPEFAGHREPVMFVDQYTQEYSRDIEPMKGGHLDNYYYQMIGYIRRFKGVRKPPARSGPKRITINGDFSDWQDVQPEYRDDLGDVMHRDHPGYDKVGRYVNKTGRNDFISLKVAADSERIYFYARTAQPITPPAGDDWMLLFIDADRNAATGWQGYDYVVNRQARADKTTSLETTCNGWKWRPVDQNREGERPATTVDYRLKANELELAIPRVALGLKPSAEVPPINFKWADNTQSKGDPAAFMLYGDTAPNSRFSYRY